MKKYSEIEYQKSVIKEKLASEEHSIDSIANYIVSEKKFVAEQCHVIYALIIIMLLLIIKTQICN